MMESLMTAHQVAELLHLNIYVVYALVRRSEIPAIRIHRTLRFRPEDVRAWVQQRRTS